jgi:type VI protein secretion system component Hcp
MRKVSAVWLALLLFAATSSTLSAQQGIYMLVDEIRGDQPAPHDREFKLNSFSSASANSASISSATSGVTVGKATFSPVKVSMRFQPLSSASFYRSVAAGTRLPAIEIRLYNATNRMFYKTVFENVFLTNVATEASDEALQQIEFVYSRAKWFASSDAAGLNAPVQVGCWDLTLGRSC